LLLLLLQTQQREQRMRVKMLWWPLVRRMDSDQFRGLFRLTRKSFAQLCTAIPPRPRPGGVGGRPEVPHDECVGIFLYRMATTGSVLDLAERFGRSKSTVCRVSDYICDAINRVLGPQYIVWPTTQEQRATISNAFFAIKKVPNVIGAIDGSHIPVSWPHGQPKEYINRKGWSSLVLQGVCDASGRFLSIFCRYPGSAHDSRVLRNSWLYRNSASAIPSGQYLLGDSGYPLLDWLITPYKGQPLNSMSGLRQFNYFHSATRMVIEHAFGRLKGRWKRLRQLDVSITRAPFWIGAGCILHNWCIVHNDKCTPEEESAKDRGLLSGNQPLDVPDASSANTMRHELTLRVLAAHGVAL